MKNVNQGIRKKDAMALLTGKPVYMTIWHPGTV